MSSLDLLARGTTKPTTTTTGSSFALLVLHAWNLCVLVVVAAALLLLSPAAVVILLPVACMAISLYLVFAIAARLLVPFVPPDRRFREHRSGGGGGTGERNQDCVEVDRAEAPGGSDDDASSGEDGHGEGPEQEHGMGFGSFGGGLGDPYDDDEQRRFYFADTGRYCRTFYDLLAYWRSMERKTAGGETNAEMLNM